MAGYYEKRGTGKYRLVVDVGADFMGKRQRRTRTVTCTSDRQADKELAKFYAECSEGKFTYSGKVSLSEFCVKWMDEYAATRAKKSTIRGYHSIIRVNISPLLGKHDIGKITPLHVQEWINYLCEEKGQSPKTLRNCYNLLSEIFATAVTWGFIKATPCQGTMLPVAKRKETPFYNEQEVSLLIEKTLNLGDDHLVLKNIILLTLFSGMRLGEIAGLKWQTVDIEKKTIRIESTRLYNPADGIYEETPKTSSSARSIAIPDICVDHLRRLKVQQLETKLLLGQLWGDDKGFVILNEHGCPMSPPGLAKRFTRFIEKEGLKKISFHGLRHTHTSMLVHMNLDIVQVSKRLGHSQLSTTQNIYTHLFKDTDQQIASELENTFATILPPKAKFQQ